MPFNLIPLFILQEAGLVFNDRSLIYTEPDMRDIYVYDHSIIDNESDLHIRLKLNGTFSTFHSRFPANTDARQELKA